MLVLVLDHCGKSKALACGKCLHDYLITHGYLEDTFIANQVINMYRRCRSLEDAILVFAGLDRKDVYSWTIIISAHTQCGHNVEALQLFRKMVHQGFRPDNVTLAIVISVCSRLSDLDDGRSIHCMITSQGVESDIVLETALVNMYVKCGSLRDGRKVFDSMSYRDVVSWAAMITGYAQDQMGREALLLFETMECEGVQPTDVSFLGALSACSILGAINVGQRLHYSIIQRGLLSNVIVGNALIHMYTKCRKLEGALKVFLQMAVKDVVSWTSMLQAYVEHGHSKDALQLFKEMQWEGIIPHKGTFVTVLKACADLGALEQGRKVHAMILARRLHTDEFVGTALIHMYARCGCIESALEVFKNIEEPNVHVWSAIIAAYADHGYEKEALLFFQQMIMKGILPNEITMISVLSACSYTGLISEFQQHFAAMSKDFGVTPNCQHYACMIDLLGHGGFLEEAENLILRMPLEPDIRVWRSMLTACMVNCDMERGKRAAENCVRLEPGYGAPYVLLSNIFAADGKWEEVAKIKGTMKTNDANQQPGRSSIEVREKIQDFVLEDGLHLQLEDVKVELDNLHMRLEEAGYTPQTSLPMHDVEEEIPLHMLKYHSERLAIVFGHIMTPPKSTLRIIKNLRVCFHCHDTIKFASELFEREIIVRDSHRFHHFKQGLCSCRDYW